MSKPDTTTLRWWTSTRSGGQGGQCVEVATADSTWYIRDSKSPDDGLLTVDHTAWQAFLHSVKVH